MQSLVRRLQTKPPWLLQLAASEQPIRYYRKGAHGSRARFGKGPCRLTKFAPTKMKDDDKSEWWTVDGEMHEIGENVPVRERFVIPKYHFANWRRKKLREQFMRRTRLHLNESATEPWCRQYMHLYSEMRENWERLYWDEGYSKKIAKDHASYDSAGDDEGDYAPYRSQHTRTHTQPTYGGQVKERGFVMSNQPESRVKVRQVRENFEYDRRPKDES